MRPPRTLLVSLILAAAAAPSVAHETDPLRTPIASDYAARWLAPEAPLRVFGNTFFVGFSGMSVGLIDTGDGLILIDGALPQAVDAIEANIRKLGFRPQDIRWILSTEPHYDHAGGLAALAKDTGATVVASPEAAEVLRRGRSGTDDPQHAWLEAFPPVDRIKVMRDGETLRLGRTVITAHATPGHTAGSMSWSWRSCEKDDCRTVVFGSSLNPISADGYRFTDPANAGVVASFRRTFARLRTLPCDILLTAHPEQGGFDRRLAAYRAGGGPQAFVDPSACRTYADAFEQRLEARLTKERDAP